jgi:hypothetical protein
MSEPRSFRDKLADDLEAKYELVVKAVEDGLAATKSVTVSCPSCKKRSEVQVQDVRGALMAAEYLSNQSLGRPGVDQGAQADDDRIVLVRAVGGSDAAAILDVAQQFVDVERQAEFLGAVAARQAEARDSSASNSSKASLAALVDRATD